MLRLSALKIVLVVEEVDGEVGREVGSEDAVAALLQEDDAARAPDDHIMDRQRNAGEEEVAHDIVDVHVKHEAGSGEEWDRRTSEG